MNTRPAWTKCPACDGRGVHEIEAQWPNGIRVKEQTTCSHCKGSGKVRKESK